MHPGSRIGILGGTLDPIHLGHVETAVAARAALALDRVMVLPSRTPPHRSNHPIASSHHRFAMAALAVNGIQGLAASDLELCAPAPSYTADTLVRFRERTGLRSTQIFFITGADAFAEIATWYRYPEVLDLANFAVVSRPGFPVGKLTAQLPLLAGRMEPAGTDAAASTAPAIFLIDAITPDVSSTEVRRRLLAGESIAGMVPQLVETHIIQHQLYSHALARPSADHLHGQN